MTDFNDIGISRRTDMPRVKKLLSVGLFASVLHFAGDMILGWGVEDESLTGIPRMLSAYYRITRCPICAYAEKLGVSELMPLFCEVLRAGRGHDRLAARRAAQSADAGRRRRILRLLHHRRQGDSINPSPLLRRRERLHPAQLPDCFCGLLCLDRQSFSILQGSHALLQSRE